MSKPLNLLDKHKKVIRGAESLTELLAGHEAKQGDHVVLCEFKKRDYAICMPHLEGAVLLKVKDGDKIFINDEFIFQKHDSWNEPWRGVYSHPKGVMTIIENRDGEQRQLVLFGKNNQRETLATFYGKYDTEEHPALLGVLIGVGNKILLNGTENKEWENENIHGLAHKLYKEVKKPSISYYMGKVWVERADGTSMEVCRHSLDRLGRGCAAYLDKGVIVERGKKIILYLIEKDD